MNHIAGALSSSLNTVNTIFTYHKISNKRIIKRRAEVCERNQIKLHLPLFTIFTAAAVWSILSCVYRALSIRVYLIVAVRYAECTFLQLISASPIIIFIQPTNFTARQIAYWLDRDRETAGAITKTIHTCCASCIYKIGFTSHCHFHMRAIPTLAIGCVGMAVCVSPRRVRARRPSWRR